MKINTSFILLAITLVFFSCGGGSGGGSDSQQRETEKSLFSQWIIQTPNENEIENLDFRGATFGSLGQFILTSGDTIICRCSLLITGNESAGKISLGTCSNIPTDCTSLENNGSPYTYEKENNELVICSRPSSCTAYE